MNIQKQKSIQFDSTYYSLFAFLFALIFICCKGENENDATSSSEPSTESPNIIIIYADDLGFGDLSCYGATEIETPNIDRIASDGIRFMNGYATSATCTPSRYALLSGEYPWRKKRVRILPGNAPLVFDTSRQTLPSMLKDAGYHTGVIGKWHLGLGDDNLDWNGKISPGPNDIGFDYSFVMASTNDRVPSVYVENRHVAHLDDGDKLEVSYEQNFPGEVTGRENPELLKLHPSHGHDMSIHNGISRIGFMRGGKSALWTDENMADTILQRSLDFISRNRDGQFFLFYSLHQPHVPRTPHPRFVEKSGMGPRGDVILEIDWAVGKMLDHLEELELKENTIVVFSSDNGPVLDDGYQDDAVTRLGSHKPAGIFRGGKYSLFEAGAHVPLMVSWPKEINPSESDALVCQLDFLGSFAKLVGQEIHSPDSKDILDAFLGKSAEGRNELVLEATGRTCYRQEDWVLIPPHAGPAKTNKWVNIETGNDLEYQLYNLLEDPGQQVNLASELPKKVNEMTIAYQSALK